MCLLPCLRSILSTHHKVILCAATPQASVQQGLSAPSNNLRMHLWCALWPHCEAFILLRAKHGVCAARQQALASSRMFPRGCTCGVLPVPAAVHSFSRGGRLPVPSNMPLASPLEPNGAGAVIARVNRATARRCVLPEFRRWPGVAKSEVRTFPKELSRPLA